MESLLLWLTEHADQAPMLIFGLLVIAGFSLPISEDLILLVSGVLASTVMPERTTELLLAVVVGNYLSDIIAYSLGRFFGKKIFHLKWISRKRLDKLEHFYTKHGIWALAIGRCIPFGFRNGIFMSAGVAKMHIGKFLLSDGIACFIFSGAVFWLAYTCSSNFEELSSSMFKGSMGLAAIGLFVGLTYAFFSWKKRQKVHKEGYESTS